jgi:PAS domain S-box-containing protein
MIKKQEIKSQEIEYRIIELEKLRAEIWKLALIAEDEIQLVQNLLDKAGPVLGCENISFMPYSENLKEIVVELQWRADGSDIGLGEIIPAWIFKRYVGKPHIQISFDKLPVLLKPVLSLFMRKYGTQSTLIIPYGHPHSPEGYISVNNYSYSRQYSSEEIDLFIELSKIIHLRSKQLQSQAALQASETRYRQIFETNQAIKLIINPGDGRIVEANQTAVRFYGYDYPTLTQMRITEIGTLPEAEVKKNLEKAQREEQLFFNFQHRLASGEIRYVEVYTGPVKTPQGELLYSIVQDVTERRRAEEALKHTTILLNESQRIAKIGSYETDLQSRTWVGSDSFIEVFGLPRKEKYTMDEFQAIVHPEDVAEVMAYFDQCLAEKKDFDYEYRCLRPDGQVIYVSSQSKISYGPNGTPLKIVGIKQDITSRKMAEFARETTLGQFKALINNLQMGILVENANRQIIHTNQFFCDLFGIPDPSAILETDCETASQVASLLFEEPSRFIERTRNILSRGEVILNEELKLKDGRTFARDYVPVYLRHDFIGNMWIYWDVTDHKQMEQRLVQQERLAAVGQLAAGIAHDFNNILTTILGYSEMLQLAPDTPAKMQASLQKITASSQRATHLVRQLLDFSRKSIRQPKPFALNAFTEDAIKFFERTIPENIQIRLTIAPGNYMIEADPMQIQQVITNLVVNARDAMLSGGKLRIDLSRLEVVGEEKCAICSEPIRGDWCCLTVADDGTGIPAGILPHIFEPFFTTKEVGQGTGLGLSQVYGIISQHGGHLTVKSRPNHGTTFTIYLPPSSAQNEQPAHELPPTMVPGKQETILLVEDEPSVLEASTAMLEHLNYQVINARHGHEALAVYRKHRAEIALIVSDMVMPDMDGEALFRTLKAENPALKMVLMSGYPLGQKGAELLQQGVVAWVEKPISVGQLSQVVSKALSN